VRVPRAVVLALLAQTLRACYGIGRGAKAKIVPFALAGLALVEPLREELPQFHLLHAVRGDLLRRLGRSRDAAAAYQQALEYAQQAPERRLLARRLAELT
jgi:predicted RNA polymerase sigma factor